MQISKWNSDYWTERYEQGATQWDAGSITTPLKDYFDQLTDRSISILIPGAGNAYEAEYLFNQSFVNITVVDLSEWPLRNLKKRVTDLKKECLIRGDFFDLDGQYDLIVEQTFFCALDPSLREAYALQMKQLLKPGGKLVGVLFEDELFEDHPPYGGFRQDYWPLFEPFFQFKVFDRCYNSIPPRQNRELFINLIRK
jgi:SAM-dependent methyltransferase